MLEIPTTEQHAPMSIAEFDRGAFYSRLARYEQEVLRSIHMPSLLHRHGASHLALTTNPAMFDVGNRVGRVRKALEESQAIALQNLKRTLGEIDLGVVWPVLKEVVLDMALYQGGGALVGGAVGAGLGSLAFGAGALPGLVVGAGLGADAGSFLLGFLGLKSVVQYMRSSLPDATHAYQKGFRYAWGDDAALAAERHGSHGRGRIHGMDVGGPGSHPPASVHLAAHQFARGHEILVVALLAGLVAYLARGKGNLPGLLAEVRQSARLGPKVADWLERNSSKLAANPRLRGAAGSSTRSAHAPGRAGSRAETVETTPDGANISNSTATGADASSGAPAAGPKRKSLREKYMGRTPGKSSATGQAVIARMREEGTVKTVAGENQFLAADGRWYPVSEADMGHNVAAVEWWNSEGKYYPRAGDRPAPEVRDWMLDPDNYELQHYSANRSAGARMTQRYHPPDPGTP